ncbi:MAG: RdgB/HAM1 family non-canonical purine NTP pyrophosphatase [Gammaproteobacteria bacterium]|nr:RdgB/HAM1 family non-canonical purine NTP pyrophosphatase [Gammaproteobacteria bacterium]
MTNRVALATSNLGKRAELEPLFKELNVEFELPSKSTLDLIRETGLSFIENALIKARAVAAATQLPTIADDSGLMVDALGGKPGIHSARYAGTPSHAERNNLKLLKALADTPEAARGAQFVCVLVYLRSFDDPQPLIGYGRWLGRILCEPIGTNGFGYDPLFFDDHMLQSAAELSSDVKNRISHRAQAAHQLQQQLAKYG